MNSQELVEAIKNFPVEQLKKDYKKVYDARKIFEAKFTYFYISNTMGIDEYVLGIGEGTFCYGMEITLEDLGSIRRHSPIKYGIYKKKNGNNYECSPSIVKLCGNNSKSDDVFNFIRDNIVKLLDAGGKKGKKNLVDIKKNPLSTTFKGKILCTYYPDYYLNVFSNSHLNHFIKKLGLNKKLLKADAVYKREALLKYKNGNSVMQNWSNHIFSCFLYTHFDPKKKDDDNLLEDSSQSKPSFPEINSIEFVSIDFKGGKKSIPPKPSFKDNKKINYVQQTKQNMSIGERGEYAVWLAERERIMNEYNFDETNALEKMRWVSKSSDSWGYDILSVSDNKGTLRYIEVKATKRQCGDMDFYFTENERQFAEDERYKDNYYLYIVYEVDTNNPKICILKNPFIGSKKLTLNPIKYKVQLSEKVNKKIVRAFNDDSIIL